MKVVEMFTGIGSQAKALQRVSKIKNIKFDIINTSEWNIHAIVAYHYIHKNTPITEEISKMTKDDVLDSLSKYSLSSDGKVSINQKYLESLKEDILKLILHSIIENNNLLDINKINGSDIPDDVGLLTYSFPCQDLSSVGSIHGYKNGIDKDANTRSGLLWQVERILEEKNKEGKQLPKYLLLENVTALEAKRHRGNFNEWQKKLIELGYINKVYKLNSEDFGVPQYRKRLIMLSVYVGKSDERKKKILQYWSKNDLNDKDYLKKLNINKKTLESILKTNYTNETFKKEALGAQPNDTDSRKKIWKNNSKIIDENNNYAKKVQTITTKQDRHPNSGNIYLDFKNDKSNYRFLTPRECFLLMGFDEEDYDVLVNNNFSTRKNSLFFSRDILYKLAGNSIVVDVLEHVFNQMVEIEERFFEDETNLV